MLCSLVDGVIPVVKGGEEYPCPYSVKGERVERALPSGKRGMIDLKFLNISIRIPAIEKQSLVQRVKDMLGKMETEATKLTNTGACQRQNPARRSDACQRDIQQKARVCEPI